MSDELLIIKDAGWTGPDAWTSIPNRFARDSRLSWEARGVLLYIASHSARWRVRITDLMREGNCGRDRTRRILVELRDLGYLEREQSIGPDGRYDVTVYSLKTPQVGPVTENPSPVRRKRRSGPVTEKPATDDPTPDDPTPENQPPYKKNNPSEDQQTEPSGGTAALVPAEDGALPLDLPEPPSKPLGPGEVVAAYVEAYTTARKTRPQAANLGKIGRDARRMIADPAVSDAELLAAAVRLGTDGRWTDLARELDRMRAEGQSGIPAIGQRSRSGGLGPAPILPREPVQLSRDELRRQQGWLVPAVEMTGNERGIFEPVAANHGMTLQEYIDASNAQVDAAIDNDTERLDELATDLRRRRESVGARA